MCGGYDADGDIAALYVIEVHKSGVPCFFLVDPYY